MVDFPLPKGTGMEGPRVMEGLREVPKGPSKRGDRFLLLPLQQGLLGALPASSTPTTHRVFAGDAEGTQIFLDAPDLLQV